MLTSAPLSILDPEIFSAITAERARQENHLELIASENFTYPAVMEAQGSVLTNKYAEGYPAKRWYGGCEYVDKIEQIAIDRAMAVPAEPLLLDDLKIIVLMVYWSFGEEPDALVLDELCDDSAGRLAH